MPVDLLAIMAHPDDAELLCGGTLAVSGDQGHRTAIVDLTRGELGSKGTPEIRAAEANDAAAVLGISARECLGLPDGHLAGTDAMRRAVVEAIRRHRPRVIITHYVVGRHPDHRTTSELVRDASFLSGLKNYPADGAPFRPERVVYTMAYREDDVRPSFIVDTTAGLERKLKAMACFASQWDGETKQGGELHPTGQHLFDLVRMQDAHVGSRIRRPYGEPYWMPEAVAVTDLLVLGTPAQGPAPS